MSAPARAPTTGGDVAAYYDRNTRRFLRYGGSRDAAAIHRRIWAPGVDSEQQAFLYLNQLAAQEIAPALPPSGGRALDLGCGVGGTTTWLAEALKIEMVGVTNSAVQQQLAQERACALGLDQRCRFILADYLDLPPLGTFQAACAIESFIHAADAGRFFAQTAAQLQSGGRLVICDDFLAPGPPPAEAQPWLERFRSGWHAHSLLTTAQAAALAEPAGLRLENAQDLSAWVRPSRPWALPALGLITRLPLRHPYWDNLAGGTALQICLGRGWTRYQAITWIKT